MPTRREALALCGVLVPGAAGCVALSGGDGVDDTGPATTVGSNPAFRLTSPAFEDGEPIPTRYTFDGDDVSPPLSIESAPTSSEGRNPPDRSSGQGSREDGASGDSGDEPSGVPDEAQSLALVMDDPAMGDGTFVHWLLWGLPPDTERIPEGIRRARRVDELDARQGTNGFGELGYRGPQPPEGEAPHTYRFTLYALDEPVNVQAGARYRALSQAMDGRVVATARLTGTYQR